MSTSPLEGVRVVSLAPNLPGPAAAMHFVRFGARVTKVEPPSGDFMEAAAPAYYRELTAGQEIVTHDLKSDEGKAALAELLADGDILLTSSRPSALTKLGLGWDALHAAHPRLVHVAIVGHPGDEAEIAGHDLTYQAVNGTLDPPSLPRVLMADLGGAERAVSAGLAALVERSRTGTGSYCEVALSDVAYDFAAPARHGMTTPDGPLGGSLPQYALYRASDGWVAVAALEGHFWARLRDALDLPDGPDAASALSAALATRTAAEWEEWARERDIPIAACAAPSKGQH